LKDCVLRINKYINGSFEYSVYDPQTNINLAKGIRKRAIEAYNDALQFLYANEHDINISKFILPNQLKTRLGLDS